MKIWTFEYLNIWTFKNLNIWTFEHFNIWTFIQHLYFIIYQLNLKSKLLPIDHLPPHYNIIKFEHLNIENLALRNPISIIRMIYQYLLHLLGHPCAFLVVSFEWQKVHNQDITQLCVGKYLQMWGNGHNLAFVVFILKMFNNLYSFVDTKLMWIHQQYSRINIRIITI